MPAHPESDHRYAGKAMPRPSKFELMLTHEPIAKECNHVCHQPCKAFTLILHDKCLTSVSYALWPVQVSCLYRRYEVLQLPV